MTINLCKLCFQVDLHLCSTKVSGIFKANAVFLSQIWIAASFHNIPCNFEEGPLVSFQRKTDARLHIKQTGIAWSQSNLSLQHTLENYVWNQEADLLQLTVVLIHAYIQLFSYWFTIYAYIVFTYHQTKVWVLRFDCVLAWLG